MMSKELSALGDGVAISEQWFESEFKSQLGYLYEDSRQAFLALIDEGYQVANLLHLALIVSKQDNQSSDKLQFVIHIVSALKRLMRQPEDIAAGLEKIRGEFFLQKGYRITDPRCPFDR
jgi:hypothetical protein